MCGGVWSRWFRNGTEHLREAPVRNSLYIYIYIYIFFSNDFEIRARNFGESNSNRAISIDQHFVPIIHFHVGTGSSKDTAVIIWHFIGRNWKFGGYEIESKDATCFSQFKIYLLPATNSHELYWAVQRLIYGFRKRCRGLKHPSLTSETWV